MDDYIRHLPSYPTGCVSRHFDQEQPVRSPFRLPNEYFNYPRSDPLDRHNELQPHETSHICEPVLLDYNT